MNDKPFDIAYVETASFPERVRHALMQHYGKTVADPHLAREELDHAHVMVRDDMMIEIHSMLRHLLSSGKQTQ